MAHRKQHALDTRYKQNPERFVKGHPTVKMPPTSVAINPITIEAGENMMGDHVNFPTLKAAGYVSDN